MLHYKKNINIPFTLPIEVIEKMLDDGIVKMSDINDSLVKMNEYRHYFFVINIDDLADEYKYNTIINFIDFTTIDFNKAFDDCYKFMKALSSRMTNTGFIFRYRPDNEKRRMRRYEQ